MALNVMESRNSYEDRICDDLSEVILQYLSLEDKLRLECVSQQFRRTVFKRHYSLVITSRIKRLSLDSIEKLIKKLMNLNEIQLFDNIWNEFVDFKRLFAETLIKHTNNLTKIVLNTNNYQELFNNDFIYKFGSTLTSLKIYNYKENLQIFPYLCRLSNIEEIFVDEVADLSDVHLRHLKRLEIRALYKEDFDHFKVLVENNRNTLRHLIILNYEVHNFSCSKSLLNLIPKLSNLIELNIGSNFSILFGEEFDIPFKQIALNCNQMKRLCFKYKIDKNNSFAELLSSLKRFKSLKRLELICLDTQFTTEKTIESDLCEFITHGGFQHLTHLKLCYKPYYFKVIIDANNMFKDIEDYLPNLQSLIMKGMEFNCNENTADILNRLSKLQTIELLVIKEVVKCDLVTKLKMKCKRITRIE